MRYIDPQFTLNRRLGGREMPRWQAAILSFRDAGGSGQLVDRLEAKPLGFELLWGMNEHPAEPYIFEASVGPARVGVVTRCLWGGPQAAVLVEELAVLRVEYVVGFSCAGSLVDDLQRGEQWVAQAALVTDGTSRAYAGKVAHPDPGLYGLAVASCASGAGACREVTVATVDAVYQETETAVEAWRRRGAHVVNMETTPFYAASTACGVKSVSLGHVSDKLGSSWEHWYEDREGMGDLTVTICVDLLRRLLE